MLSIDADERVPPELSAEIQTALDNSVFDVDEMPRSSYYCGRFMRHSGWWPDTFEGCSGVGLPAFRPHLVHESLQNR